MPPSPAAKISNMVTSVVITRDWKLDKFSSWVRLTTCQLLILRFIYLFIPSYSLKKSSKCGWMLDNIFPKFSFSNKVWFWPNIFPIIFIWPTFANICCPYFSKESRFQKCLLFFHPRHSLWSRVQQNHPDEKSVGDFQSWESNRGQQWLSRTNQIKICPGFRWGQNFHWFLKKK